MSYPLTPEQILAIRQSVGSSLRKKREAAQVTKYLLAKAAGLSFFTVNGIEEGRKDFRIDTFLLYKEGLRRLRDPAYREQATIEVRSEGMVNAKKNSAKQKNK